MADYTVRRDRLTVFVVGPGFGESVLVALPESNGWIVIDGAGPTKSLPAKVHLEKHWTDESFVELLLLTHPHADHYPGVRQLLDDGRIGPRVRRVGCVCEYLGAEGTLSAEVQAAFSIVDIDDAETRMALGRAQAVLERISAEWLERPDTVFRASAGMELSLGAVTVSVLSPTRAETVDFFARDKLAERILHHANDLSVVLEIRYGGTALVLGADLPSTRGKTTVPSGWSSVATRHDALDRHAGYKIAHHASAEAIHETVVRADRRTGPRAWVTTPYNKGEKLPDFADGGGMAALLGSEESGVALTALPVGCTHRQHLTDTVRRSEIGPDTFASAGLGALVRATGPSKAAPTDCFWIFEFDDKGSEIGRVRGQGATLVLAG